MEAIYSVGQCQSMEQMILPLFFVRQELQDYQKVTKILSISADIQFNSKRITIFSSLNVIDATNQSYV